MSRGKVFTIRDPAEAAAVAKCWLADYGTLFSVNSFHERECTYCPYPRDLLIESLEEFEHWAGLHQEEAPLRDEVERFLMLSSDEQARLVRARQYGDA